jgi:hypothetical protein
MKKDLMKNIKVYIFFAFLSFSCTSAIDEYIYKTNIRAASDISINYSKLNYTAYEDTIIISPYKTKNNYKLYAIYRKEFKKFILDYPSPWIENNIVFELGDSTNVKLLVLDSDKNDFKKIFEYTLSQGVYEIKPFYIFNPIPHGNYYYSLELGNEKTIRKLDIIRK